MRSCTAMEIHVHALSAFHTLLSKIQTYVRLNRLPPTGGFNVSIKTLLQISGVSRQTRRPNDHSKRFRLSGSEKYQVNYSLDSTNYR
jgi:hypothetical protein